MIYFLKSNVIKPYLTFRLTMKELQNLFELFTGLFFLEIEDNIYAIVRSDFPFSFRLIQISN